MPRLSISACLLALGQAVRLDSGVTARHGLGPQEGPAEGPAEGGAAAEAHESRLELSNYLDLQYYARVRVGTPPQEITGIIDTGSFELVVFSTACHGCGTAAAFDGGASGTRRLGRLVTQLTYGSGDVEGDQVQDFVALGASRAVKQNFWEVHKASMKLLEHARFESILGVGPPETPAADAWDFASKAVKEVADAVRADERRLPSRALVRNVESTMTSALEISKSKTMLANFGVRAFSICLGRRPGSSGYFVWNDTMAQQRPQLFTRLPVIGKHSWTLSLTDVRLRHRGPAAAGAGWEPMLGCREGCGAIVDSGTSLLVVPPGGISVMTEALQAASPDCDSLHELPNLVMTIGGMEITLPPDAYVARRRGSGPCRLELSVMQSTSTSEAGPVWILGMPFLRQYYTTFDVGSGRSDRALHIAPASGNCTPAGPEMKFAADRTKPYVRTIEWDSMYVPPLVKRATSEKFLRI